MLQSGMQTLSKQQIKTLRSKAHHLKPVVSLGNKGLTKNVITETDIALKAHELIKVKIPADKVTKIAIAEELAQQCSANLLQVIGHIAVLYRKNEEL